MFLKLTKISDQSESIIKFKDSYFTMNVEKVYTHLKEQDSNLLYSIENNEGIIFKNEKVIKKGYVWNSSSVKKVVVYKINEMKQLSIIDRTDDIPKTYLELKKEVLNEIKEGRKLVPVQYGLGYASNLISTQFPLTEYKYPNELSRELLSKMKYLRMCKSDSDSEDDSEDESNTNDNDHEKRD
jgi:hypothetical protein